MNIIGFLFTKIHAHKSKDFKKGLNKKTDLQVIDIQKESAPLNTKDTVARFAFKYEIIYSDPDAKKDNILGEIGLEGTVSMLMTEEQYKELSKSWKKKEIPSTMQEGLFNFLLRKCTPKAIDLQDSVSLPFHIPMPQIKINRSK